MRTSDADLLIIPGLDDSGADHWQTRWQQKLSAARRVEQSDWSRPRREDWVTSVREAVNRAEKPVVLIAHSLGVLAAVNAVPHFAPGKVIGAFFVAPPSEEAIRGLDLEETGFETVPRDPLPFPSLLVASRNDPFADYQASEDLANAWGSAILDAGEAGHINAESGHGPWPEGLMSFAAFMARLQS